MLPAGRLRTRGEGRRENATMLRMNQAQVAVAEMNLVTRNAEIVALVKARKMPMREIAARYRLSTSSISLIAIRQGVHAQAHPKRCVRRAS